MPTGQLAGFFLPAAPPLSQEEARPGSQRAVLPVSLQTPLYQLVPCPQTVSF